MPPLAPSNPPVPAFVRFGGWLFARRTALPLPLAAAILFIPARSASPGLVWVGAAAVAAGEAIRLWAVRHIGAISRTRSGRLGPLVCTGPFALVRNPLYLGNIALWAGFALCARLAWLAPIIVILLAVEYHAIVQWEEQLLESRLGEDYRTYAASVPRWMPRASSPRLPVPSPTFGWRDTLFSERGTLVAIALGCALLALKNRL